MNPDDVRVIARGGMLTALGLELAEITLDRVVATLPIEAHHLQPFS